MSRRKSFGICEDWKKKKVDFMALLFFFFLHFFFSLVIRVCVINNMNVSVRRGKYFVICEK